METFESEGRTGRVQHKRSGAEDPVPLVYLHSAFGEVGELELFDALADAGFDVTAPEIFGFGKSEPVEHWYGIADVVYSLREAFDALGVDDAVVVGASLGGWLAAELAVWFPARVRGLVLVDPVGLHIDDAPLLDMFHISNRELIGACFPSGDDIVKYIEPALEDPGDPDAVLLHFFSAMEAAARIGWNPYMHDPQLRRRLPDVEAETLVLWGDRDGIVPREHAEAYAAEIPNARLEVLAGAGHIPTLECPGDVAAATAARFAGS